MKPTKTHEDQKETGWMCLNPGAFGEGTCPIITTEPPRQNTKQSDFVVNMTGQKAANLLI